MSRRRNVLVNWRLRYARLGWHTFLVHGIKEGGLCDCGDAKCRAVGKHPRRSGKLRGATIDESAIRSEGRFETSNIGLHLGLSNLVVIDIDPRNGGNDTIKALERKYGRLDSAIISDTGGGGEHRFFCAPPDMQALPSTLGPGVDVLSGNKYPVLPPSPHRSGKEYRWRGRHEPFYKMFLLTYPPSWVYTIRGREQSSERRQIHSQIEESELEVARLKSALEYISADCSRSEWRDTLYSLQSMGWESGEEIARDWSLTAPHRWSEAEFEAIWNGADPAKEGGRKVASIFHRAKQEGWIDPKRSNQAETLGDIDNGRRFAHRYRDELVFDAASKKWLGYDAGIWRPCQAGEEVNAAKTIADEVLREAGMALAKNPSEANRTAHQQALKVHRSAQRVYSMLDMARAETGMSAFGPSAFDQDPMKLGVSGGVIDLTTGKLLPSAPDYMISKCVGVPIDRTAKCPRWLGFLHETLANSAQVHFLQRFVGYTLTGLVDEEVLLFMTGTGANGKSVMANVISGMMGDYATTVGTDLLATTKHDSEAARYKAKLLGARMALVNEVGQSETFNDQRLKEVVSRERIPSRHLYGEAFDFQPTHALWVRGNHRPAVLDSGDGMWRRIILLPFQRQFRPEERIPDLDRQLLDEEGSGILNWAIEGCLEWQQRGLSIPKSIQRETMQYREDTDVAGEWLETHCAPDPAAKCELHAIYESYRSYMLEAGVSPKSQPAFSRMMGSKGFKRIKSNSRSYVLGIRLNPSDI